MLTYYNIDIIQITTDMHIYIKKYKGFYQDV